MTTQPTTTDSACAPDATVVGALRRSAVLDALLGYSDRRKYRTVKVISRRLDRQEAACRWNQWDDRYYRDEVLAALQGLQVRNLVEALPPKPGHARRRPSRWRVRPWR